MLLAGEIVAILLAYLGGAMLTGYIAARCGDVSPASLTIVWPLTLLAIGPVLAVKWAIRKGEGK